VQTRISAEGLLVLRIISDVDVFDNCNIDFGFCDISTVVAAWCCFTWHRIFALAFSEHIGMQFWVPVSSNPHILALSLLAASCTVLVLQWHV
jgi:hypothetical protein